MSEQAKCPICGGFEREWFLGQLNSSGDIRKSVITGNFVWWVPQDDKGWLTSKRLRWIADELDRRNAQHE